MFFGNLFVYFQFQGKDHIDEATRRLVFIVLIIVAVLGVFVLATLQRVSHPFIANGDITAEQDYEADASVVGAFKNAIDLFFTKEMLLLSTTFLYTGKPVVKLMEFFFIQPLVFFSLLFSIAIVDAVQ